MTLLAIVAWGAGLARSAAAWERRDLLTRPIVAKATWLDRYAHLRVEAASPDSDPTNPNYVPVYLDHLPGERESARDILVRYVDEPDWGMDQGLELSPFQPLTGGSQGYRDQYDYFFAGVVRLGDAPGRVSHYYDLAVRQMKAGHPYWAFRDLARALHYLEDLADPLNTQPYTVKWLWRARFSPQKMKILSANFRFGYDTWVRWHLMHELAAGDGPLLEALQAPPPMPFIDPQTAALALSEYSHGKASALLADLGAFFPKRVLSLRKITLPTPDEIKPRRLSPAYYRIEQSTADSLRIMSGAVSSVLSMASRDFAKASKH